MQPIALATRVLMFSSLPGDNLLEFRLIFADGYEKYYKLSEHEARAFRCSERDLIEHMARDYYADAGYPTATIELIFL